MKKLNITKEQFNKSRYFKNKYGKLEYVSESGRLFKTNKGKVLMFKEGRDPDFDDDLDNDYYDGGHLDADEDNPKFAIGDKVIWNDSLWKVIDCWYDSIEGSNLYDLKGLDTREETSDVPGDELCAHDGGIAYESNRKFGKKFKESYDSDAAKEKFFGVLTDELGIPEDEFEDFVEGLDENYDLMNDLMMKLLDGQSLDRTEQIQVAYFLADKLENHF